MNNGEHRPPRRIIEDPLTGRTNTVPIEEDLDGVNVDVPPPAYDEQQEQIRFSQAGFNANAAVTGESESFFCYRSE